MCVGCAFAVAHREIFGVRGKVFSRGDKMSECVAIPIGCEVAIFILLRAPRSVTFIMSQPIFVDVCVFVKNVTIFYKWLFVEICIFYFPFFDAGNLCAIFRVPSDAKLIFEERIDAVHGASLLAAVYPYIFADGAVGVTLVVAVGAFGVASFAIFFVESNKYMLLSIL